MSLIKSLRNIEVEVPWHTQYIYQSSDSNFNIIYPGSARYEIVNICNV